MSHNRKIVLALALPLALGVSACSAEAEEAEAAEETAQSNETVAELLSGVDGVGKVATAFKDSGLSSVFDTAAAYTVLAPQDDAFTSFAGKIGVVEPAQQAAVIRGHVLPGYMTLEDIAGAVKDGRGEVKVAAMDGTDLTFSQMDEGLSVRGADGTSANLVTEKRGLNGVVITIDNVLKAPPEG